MSRLFCLLIAALPTLAHADITVTKPMVPLAPPAVMAHAGYMTLTNDGAETRSLVAVSADGYAMAHLHLSTEKDGVAMMSAMHQIDIAPGKSVVFEQGGLHVMLMRPETPTLLGNDVVMHLEFADGEVISVTAPILPMAQCNGS